MADLPYPLQSTSIDELRVQMLDMFRDLYEVRIGGSLIGDVFEVEGDVLQLKLKTGSGLQKTNGELDFDLSTINAPAAAVLRSNYTAKGALISASAASTIGVLGVGTDGQMLKADSTQTLGLAWTTLSGSLFGLGSGDTPTFASVKLTNLTSGRIPYVTTGDELTDDADMTFSGDTLTATKVAGTTHVDTPKITTIGDLTVDCGTNKTILLSDVVWDDIRITPGSFDRPGVTDPTIVAYDVNGGGVSTYLWQFQKNAIASFTVQLPHSYKVGTDIAVHIHWTPGANGVTENGNTVGWKIDYSWANINGNFPTMSTADLSDACDGTNHKHQMTPDITIDGHTVSKGISSMLLCNVKRTDTGADDTWSGTASGALPLLLEIDFHFQIDTIGSREQAAK